MSQDNGPAKILERAEVPENLKWRLEDMYASDEDWEADFASITADLPKLTAFAGKVGSSAGNLLACIKLQERLSELTAKVFTYSRMRKDENNADSEYQGMHDRAAGLAVKAQSAASFINPEILAIPEETLNGFFDDEPGLGMYRHFLDDITRRRAHTLPASEERIVAMSAELGNAIPTIFTMLNNADLKYPAIEDEDGNTVEITKGRFIGFMESRDRRVRRDAFRGLYSSYKALINTIASTYSASVKSDAFVAKVRNYPDSITAGLDQNNIPVAVYDNLTSAVRENLDLMHRYVGLRKRALGLDELHMYDVYTPVVPDVEWPVTYDEAKAIVTEGLAPLGEEYIRGLVHGMESGWIDVCENRGKTSGAYSWGVYDTHPYVLLNWQDTMDNMFTLAHEMGHSMHSYYTWNAQPFIYSDYSIFLAEVASTVNEVLLMRSLLKTVDDKMRRLYLLNHFLESFRGTVFRQTMFAEFERRAHEMHEAGQPLTPEALCAEYKSLNHDYFGPDMVLDEEIAFEWARIPHFYTEFYVYQYATGFSAAVAIADAILTEGEPARNRYIDFLKGGSSAYPLELLKTSGVDMTTADPVRRALKVFEETLAEMEEFFEA